MLLYVSIAVFVIWVIFRVSQNSKALEWCKKHPIKIVLSIVCLASIGLIVSGKIHLAWLPLSAVLPWLHKILPLALRFIGWARLARILVNIFHKFNRKG